MGEGDDREDLVIVTMIFDAADAPPVAALLSRYVVMSRGHPGCRNIDLCRSLTVDDRFVVISKWASNATQRAHLDSPEMVQLAHSIIGHLRSPPTIDLLEGISAHDLI